MQEIITMLIFDGSDQGWAVISRGPADMAKAKGETILKSFVDFERWKDGAKENGFLPALIDYLHELRIGATGSIPERVVCAECGRPKENLSYILYS
jgi:hypothetical protein